MEPQDTESQAKDDSNHDSQGSGSAFGGKRKRVVSREVLPQQADAPRKVAEEMRAAARGPLKPMDVIDIPNLPPRAGLNEAILDPTLISERKRGNKQNYLFQATRILTALVFIASCAAIALLFFNHRLWAQAISGTACAAAAASIKLVRSSRLLYRLRGYVAAGCVLSVLAVALTIFLPSISPVDGHNPTPKEAKPR